MPREYCVGPQRLGRIKWDVGAHQAVMDMYLCEHMVAYEFGYLGFLGDKHNFSMSL